MCEMCRLLVILLCLVVAVTLEYDLKCPDSGEWRLRAIGFNCSIKSQYVCLFKYPERTYHETCDGLDYSSIGSKLIYEPFFNKAYCSYERYQPFPFSTDGNSKCVYEKSVCTEKGQYLFQRGSQRSDITCGCDLTKGYEFVTKPNQDCYCVPSAEDCSCYKIPCNNLVDQCPQDRDEILTTSMLTTFQENRFKDAINLFDDKNNGKRYRFQCLYISSALLACMIIVMILFRTFVVWIIVQRANRWRNNTSCDLPEAINQLSQEDKTRYNKLMQSEKTEKRYFVRTLIVGKESVGKTCLLRRLLKEKIDNVTSTDGVDIVVSRCKINIQDGKWTIGKEINDDKIGRIKRALNTNTEDSDTHHKQVDETRNMKRSQTDEMPTDNKETTTDDDKNESSSLIIHQNLVSEVNINGKYNDTNESASSVIPEDLVADTKVYLDNNKNTNEFTPLVMPADLMSNVFSKSTENTLSNIYALCELWDFAGQKEFYATHQAFLTSCAVYIVVADMKDDICKQSLSQCFDDFKKIGEYVDFWFDSIHCHQTTNEKTSNGHIDPPIVLVFTGKDKYKEADLKKRENELDDQMNSIFGLKSKYYHLHSTFYLSNTNDSDEEFEKLRYAIYKAARKMDNWGKEFPLKWILLEHLIEINKNAGKNFINFTDMFKLAKHPDVNILEKEDLLLFLRFQHNVGNIIFFENILDLIILRPQWLADAYRCLVSDRVGSRRLYNLEDWTLFTRQGKISESLITELFELKGGRQFSGQNINLHKVMEKLDILVKFENSGYSLMPSQMPSTTFEDVCDKFGILKEKCKRTSWLCFKFEFLPPSFFNHISAWFIRKYDPSKLDSGIALYRGICMFDIDRSGGTKIMVTMSTDTIALQVMTFSGQLAGLESTCSGIYNDVTQLFKDIKERYKVKLSFKLHFKCSDGYYFKDTFEYEILIIEKKCFCIQHKQVHRSDQILSPWMNNEVKEIPDRAKIKTTQDDQNPENEPNKEEAQDQTPVKANLPVLVNLRQQFNIKQSTNENLYIYSCIKTGNTLVFTDCDNKRLIICNSDGTNKHHMSLSYSPRYITEIDSNTVAVSCRYNNTILINISTRSITSTINTSGDCSGISYNDNNLYVVMGSTIHVMDLTGKVIRTIPVPSDDITDITVDRDRLVCKYGSSIYCCSLEGKVMWKFKKDEYQDFGRVTTDNEGNVYVTDRRTNTVIVVSDDGKHHRELLTESDGLDKPRGIYFDRKENSLLVCNRRGGNAFLFEVKKKP